MYTHPTLRIYTKSINRSMFIKLYMYVHNKYEQYCMRITFLCVCICTYVVNTRDRRYREKTDIILGNKDLI